MPPSYDNFNSSCMQKCYQILIPKLVKISHKPPNTIGRRLSIMYFCVLSETRNSLSQWYPIWKDIPASQSTLKQSYIGLRLRLQLHILLYFFATSSLFTRVQLLLIICHDNKLFSFTELEASLLQTACSYCYRFIWILQINLPCQKLMGVL